ncbi:hypothetical protein [Streptomyces chiangmaiensis]|uniref:hypothetical protein n=1 Tax=Streptomyces chiangmaiensis TaxID=766497 RepID=UPI00337E3DC4
MPEAYAYTRYGDGVACLVGHRDLNPCVTGTFPLERAGEVLRAVGGGHARSKIVIEVGA